MAATKESKYRKLADEEATRAEAESPDEEEEAEAASEESDEDAEGDEEESDSEPAEEAGPPSAEQVQSNIEAAHVAYVEALSAAFADGWEDMAGCWLCSSLGFVADPGPKMKPDIERCPDCNGRGWQGTPSFNPDHERETCFSCSGNGWRQRVAPVETTLPVYNGTNTSTAAPPPMPPMPTYDPQLNVWRDQFGNILATQAG